MSSVTLLSSDGEAFVVDVDVAMQSPTLKYMIENNIIDNGIPLPDIGGEILSRVIEYCKKHAGPDRIDRADEEELISWDSDFVKVDRDTLFELVKASKFLDIKNLLDLTCRAVADMIKGKSAAEIRRIFKVEYDFSAEEEAQILEENEWAFD
ncbi:SKP1-like protein 1B [Senna tora]|uniref:SKP1-like protein n=1 Tax=Senna tora TaxID=362788 RepID=A0A834TE82_9FABA|nr:SKP1-like protein 1B [Senna tora]